MNLLYAEMRKIHQELKNEGRKAMIFRPVAVALLQSQTHSDGTEGILLKLLFKEAGP